MAARAGHARIGHVSFCASVFLSPDYLHLPGVGLAITQWALLGGCLMCAAREKRLRITRGGVLLAVLSALLALCYALYANDMLRMMNLPVLFGAHGAGAVFPVRTRHMPGPVRRRAVGGAVPFLPRTGPVFLPSPVRHA